MTAPNLVLPVSTREDRRERVELRSRARRQQLKIHKGTRSARNQAAIRESRES
jgi:hypothetical protein